MTIPILARVDFRQAGWAGVFLAILAALLFPAILVSAAIGHSITMIEQAALILAATMAVQLLRRESLAEVTGRVEPRRLLEFAQGILFGTVLMIVPAIVLWAGGWVQFGPVGTSALSLLKAAGLMLGVALAEELLFRGLLFQRLIDAIGTWPAQFVIGALFALTHLGNPGMTGVTKIWASANIFLASIMFGCAYLRTRSLAMPIGLHFAANLIQGVVLGFGVSGTDSSSLLVPAFGDAPSWLTGGAFGLEASALGLAAVVGVLVLLTRGGRAGGDYSPELRLADPDLQVLRCPESVSRPMSERR